MHHERLIDLAHPPISVQHIKMIREIPQRPDSPISEMLDPRQTRVFRQGLHVLENAGPHEGVGNDDGADADLGEHEHDDGPAALLEGLLLVLLAGVGGGALGAERAAAEGLETASLAVS